MADFTKGEWRIEGPDMFGDYNVLHSRNSLNVLHSRNSLAVAGVMLREIIVPKNLRDAKEVKANARLIAAAPELYEALKSAQFALGGTRRKNPLHQEAWQIVTNALAKAEAGE